MGYYLQDYATLVVNLKKTTMDVWFRKNTYLPRCFVFFSEDLTSAFNDISERNETSKNGVYLIGAMAIYCYAIA